MLTNYFNKVSMKMFFENKWLKCLVNVFYQIFSKINFLAEEYKL